jgi:hypothetical protein
MQISASRVFPGRWGTFAARWDSLNSLGLLIGSHKSNEPPRDFLLKNTRVSSLAVRVCEEFASHRNRALVEDRLDGSSNFISWKSRLCITLEESDLLRLI